MAKGMSGMMKQVQKMQKKMMQLQEELAEQRVEGTAGGGMVTAVVDGKLNVVEIRINPEAVDPEDGGNARRPRAGRHKPGTAKGAGNDGPGDGTAHRLDFRFPA